MGFLQDPDHVLKKGDEDGVVLAEEFIVLEVGLLSKVDQVLGVLAKIILIGYWNNLGFWEVNARKVYELSRVLVNLLVQK